MSRLKAAIRPAAVFFTCPKCEATIFGAVDRPGGDALPYWRIEDAPEPRDVSCGVCAATVRLTAPWHRKGVYPALDLARSILGILRRAGLTVVSERFEMVTHAIRRPEGYEPGAGDAWAVWWQDSGGTRREIVIVGDLTGGPAVFGGLPEPVAAMCGRQGVRTCESP
jgi:hypothetical protein